MNKNKHAESSVPALTSSVLACWSLSQFFRLLVCIDMQDMSSDHFHAVFHDGNDESGKEGSVSESLTLLPLLSAWLL